MTHWNFVVDNIESFHTPAPQSVSQFYVPLGNVLTLASDDNSSIVNLLIKYSGENRVIFTFEPVPVVYTLIGLRVDVDSVQCKCLFTRQTRRVAIKCESFVQNRFNRKNYATTSATTYWTGIL